MNFLLESEPQIRLFSFVSVLVLFTTLEWLRPAKAYSFPRQNRWWVNFSMVTLDSVLVRALSPLLAVEAAALAQNQSWGLLSFFDWSSTILVGVISFLILDIAIYFQHRLFHQIPILWRLHRVHHSDVAIDVSTALRFHPIEIFLSMIIKVGLVLAFGISPIVVIVFEVALNASSIFNHANWDMGRWDSWVRKILVTPYMHRIHHSHLIEETNSNFGFCLSLWDRIFGTWIEKSKDSTAHMTIGLDEFRSSDEQSLLALLKNPFIRKTKNT